jgi:phosphoribosyl 1,2-cyclic phosphodiesterase
VPASAITAVVVGDPAFVFSVLGSGSGGNAVFVEAMGRRFLVDAGLSARACTERLGALGLSVPELDAILLTHEHGDHVAHARSLAARFRAPLVATAGTFSEIAGRLSGREARVVLAAGRVLRLPGVEVEAVAKPHDAREPVAFVLRSGSAALGVFTDLGSVDSGVGEALAGCTAVVLESNHDPAMLARGPYPARLKARVGGSLGHLSNEDSAEALARHAGPRLHTVVLGHLSTTNNDPQRVRAASLRRLGQRPGFARWISAQDRPTPLLRANLGITPCAATPGGA